MNSGQRVGSNSSIEQVKWVYGWGLTRLFLAATFFTVGCVDEVVLQPLDGIPWGGGEEEPPPPTEQCRIGEGPVDECGAELCIDEVLHIQVTENRNGDGLTCAGYGGAEQCQGNNDYQSFDYDGEETYLYFSFDPAISGNYSDENFKRYFDYIWLNIYFPGYTRQFYHQVWAQFDLDYFESFTYENGRLKGRIDTFIDQQYQEVESDADSCISGDIAGQCYCSYDIPVHVILDFDLEVER